MKQYIIKYKTKDGIKESICTQHSINQFVRVLDIVEIKEIEKPKRKLTPDEMEYRRKYNCLYARYRRGSIGKNEFDEAIRKMQKKL